MNFRGLGVVSLHGSLPESDSFCHGVNHISISEEQEPPSMNEVSSRESSAVSTLRLLGLRTL